MSELEKFIKQEHDSFNEEYLPLGHENRFLMKLEKDKLDKESSMKFWRVAAAIIVLLVAGGSLLLPRFNSPADVQYGSMSLSEVSADMANIEMYYTSELEKKYKDLQEMAETDMSVRELFDELAILKDQYEELEKDLYRSGSNDRVILAMIENFRLRLSLVEKLENIKQEKSKS
ncbi:MAG: hypothetical protein MK086_12725 [Flavobacteriales bacterium]|nr:hypothetical protein [Flavobacteriales bacterium]